MKRVLLLSAGWLLAAGALYAALLLLELYWNILNWYPTYDWAAWGLLAWMGAVLGGMWRLACHTRDRISRVVSLITCASLLIIGLVVFPPEPLSEGLLGRAVRSPLWYRVARVVVLALPGVFWVVNGRRPRQGPSESR